MIVECQACHTRFRLDESRIQGRGARMRCRKCGEAIIVMKDPGDRPAPPPKNLFDLRSVLRQPEVRTAQPKEHPPGPVKPSAQAPEWRPAAPEPEIPAAHADVPQEEPAAPEPEITAAHTDVPQEEPTAGEVREEAPEIALPDAWPGEAVSLRANGEAEPEPEYEAAEPAPPAPEEEPAALEPEIPAVHADVPQEEPAAWEAPAAVDRAKMEDLFGSTMFSLGVGPPPAEEKPIELMLNNADSLDFLKEEYRRAETEADFDISGNLRPGPSAEEEPAEKAPEVVTRQEPPEEVMPDRLEAIQRELQEIGGGSPDAPEPSPPLAAVSSVPPVRKIPARPAAPAPREKTARAGRPAILTLLLLFLVIAGGGAYLGFTPGGQENLRRLVPLMESLWLGGEQAAPRYAVGNLIGYYEPNAKTGKLFVIKGTVTNQGRKKRSGIRVQASLFDRNGQPVAQKTAFAGNVLPGEDLRTLPRETIEKGMANRWGDRLANLDVVPGKSIPFMVVFFDAPEGIEEYRTEARDVD